MRSIFRFLLPSTIVLLLSACPGNGGGGPAHVEGVWSGAFTGTGYTGTVSVQGAFRNDGFGFLIEDDTFLDIFPHLPDQTDLSGKMYDYVLPTQVCPTPACSTIAFYNIQGTAYTNQMFLTAQYFQLSPAPPVVKNFTLQSAVPYAGMPAVIPGQWQGYYLPSNLASSLDLKSDGSFTGADAYGCVFNGSLVQNAPDSDVFQVTLDGGFIYHRPTSGCTGKFIGAGYLSSTGSGPFKGVTGTYLIVALEATPVDTAQGQTNFYLLEFKLQ